MTPVVIRTFLAMLVLVLTQSVQVHCIIGYTVRPNGVPHGPEDYLLTFVHDWRSKAFFYDKGVMQLRCYIVRYMDKDKPITSQIERFNLVTLESRHNLAIYVRPHFYRHGWRVQCDFRYIVASKNSLKQGVVLSGGSLDDKCKSKNGGCQIVFTMGQARRLSMYGIEFLGELYESKCWSLFRYVNCKEREHPQHMFGNFCDDRCNFPCYKNHCEEEHQLGSSYGNP